MAMVMTICNAIFLLIYLLSAAVQYNDPDGIVWAAMYLAAAAMCALQFRRNPPRWLAPVLVAISVVWIGVLLPHILGQVTLEEIFASISMRTRAVEEAREIGGLLLVILWAAVLWHRQRAAR
jgi:hypothetical protein